jgi:hypothetical protein
MVSIMRRVKKQIIVTIDMEQEEVKVMVDGQDASTAQFTIDGSQIMVTSVDTEKVYRKCGYGRLLFDGLKCVANQKKMPLILWSSDYALGIKFYEKIGFLHLNNPEVQKRIFFGNLETAEDIAAKIDEDDFIWIPQSLNKRKPIIYM